MSTAPETIKERLSVADVIGSYIKLEKAGVNFKAKCPFHNERTPSFHVSISRGTYYCFGCGAKGDIFSFVEQFEGVDFKGALKLLALKAGVVLEDFKENKTFELEKKELYSALEEATVLFERQLGENPSALNYIKGRGLSDKTIKDWRLGYALPEWRTLKSKLIKEGVSEMVLEKTGLIKKGDTGKESYDVFRGRIMFPIFDSASRVVAFSGRIIVPDEHAPKYLNSPDTTLFNKSEILYGLHKAKVPIRRKGYAVLVEGQMDLLMCHQAGFDNTVATSGTALTEDHVKRLKTLSSNFLMVFDGDNAGFKASGRASQIALSLGVEVKLGALPQGLDPADLILQDKKAWGDVLKNSKQVIDFHLEHISRQNLPDRKLIKEIEKQILPLVRGLQSELDRAHYVAKIRDITSLPENVIWKELQKIGENALAKAVEVKDKQAISPSKNETGLFDFTLGVLLSLQEKNDNYGKTLRQFLEKICGKNYLEKAIESVDEFKERLIFEAERAYPEGFNESSFEEFRSQIEKSFLKKRKEDLTREIKKMEMLGNKERIEQLLEEFNVLMKKK